MVSAGPNMFSDLLIFGPALVFFRRDMSGRESWGREEMPFRCSSSCTRHFPGGGALLSHDGFCPAAIWLFRDACCLSQRIQGCRHGGFRVFWKAGWGQIATHVCYLPRPSLTRAIWRPFFLYAQTARGCDNVSSVSHQIPLVLEWGETTSALVFQGNAMC